MDIEQWLVNYNDAHPMPAERPSLFSMIIVALIVGGVAVFVVEIFGTFMTFGSERAAKAVFVLSLLAGAAFAGLSFLIMVTG